MGSSQPPQCWSSGLTLQPLVGSLRSFRKKSALKIHKDISSYFGMSLS